MFEHFLEGPLWFWRFGGFGLQNALLILQGFDLLLERPLHREAVRLKDAVDEVFDLTVDLGDVPLEALVRFLRPCFVLTPDLLEHGESKVAHFWRRLDGMQQHLESAFEITTPDRFTIRIAVFVEAHVVRMLLARFALRPAGGERLVVVATGDEAAQRKVRTDVLPCGHPCPVFDTLLNTGKLIVADKTLMHSFDHVQAPVGDMQIACKDRAGQETKDLFVSDFAAIVFRIVRFAFEKAFHLGLRLKMARGKPKKGCPDDPCHRIIWDQNFAMGSTLLKLIAWRRWEAPIAFGRPSLHPVTGLLPVVLTLVLTDARQEVFDQNGMRIVAKLDRRAFKLAAHAFESAAQRPMAFDVPRKTAYVVDYHSDRMILRLHIRQEAVEGRAMELAAGDGFVGEDL